MRFKSVFFDLDGTLTDPREGIINCIQGALKEYQIPCPARNDLEWCIGPPLKHSFLDLGAQPEQVEQLIATYRSRYGEVGLFENEMYPEIPDLLEKLKNSGRQLFVATSKPKVYAEKILEHFDLLHFFEEIYGAHLDGRFTEKGELVQHIQSELKLNPNQTTLIGDRKFDIQAALQQEWYAVGGLWGFGTRDELLEAKADVIVFAGVRYRGHRILMSLQSSGSSDNAAMIVEEFQSSTRAARRIP